MLTCPMIRQKLLFVQTGSLSEFLITIVILPVPHNVVNLVSQDHTDEKKLTVFRNDLDNAFLTASHLEKSQYFLMRWGACKSVFLPI